MYYRFFQFGNDDEFIGIIVKTLSSNYFEVKESEEWFRWRFEQNPSGEAILSCAFDSDKLVAFMALEKVPLCNSAFGIVRYAFVLDGYDANDLFTKLLELIETEARKQQLISVLLVELQDYYSNNPIEGWEVDHVKVRYRTRFVKPLRSIFKLGETKKTFVANANIPHDEKIGNALRKGLECITMSDSEWNKKYLQWRYLMARDYDFLYVEDQDVFAIAVSGSKGRRIKDVQLLMMATKKTGAHLNRFKKVVIGKMVEQTSPDTVSCIDSDKYLTGGNSVKVTRKVSVCYKRFDGMKVNGVTEMINTIMRYFV